MQIPPEIEILRVVRAALAEDVGSGDVTTLSTVPEQAMASAKMVARESLVVCGLAVAEAAFREINSAVQIERIASDGQRVGKGETLLKIIGPARPAHLCRRLL